jgi:predicted ester cyclase
MTVTYNEMISSAKTVAASWCGAHGARSRRRPTECSFGVCTTFGTGDLDTIQDVYSGDFVAHFPPSSELPERRGLNGIRQGITRIRSAFPDWCEHVDDVLADGAHVVSCYTSRGTHRGTLWGIPPTGRTITVPEISIFGISDGKVVEQWCMVDVLGRLKQLGALPERLQFGS